MQGRLAQLVLAISAPLSGSWSTHTNTKIRHHAVAPTPRHRSIIANTADRLDDLPLGRRIFCNRALNMEKIQSVGFDMDYTLAEYTRDFDLLAYDGAVRKLLDMGYPPAVAEFVYNPERYQRGLLIDKRRGNLIKLDRHKYVKVAYHGLDELSSAERKRTYTGAVRHTPATISSSALMRAPRCLTKTLICTAPHFPTSCARLL